MFLCCPESRNRPPFNRLCAAIEKQVIANCGNLRLPSLCPPPKPTLCIIPPPPPVLIQVRAQLAAVWRTCWPLPELKTFWWWCPDGENVAGLYVHYCSPLWWKTLAGAWHGRRDRVLRFDALWCTGNRKGWCVVDPVPRAKRKRPSNPGRLSCRVFPLRPCSFKG